MFLIRFVLVMLLVLPAVVAQENSCPEGYIPKPSDGRRGVECVWVGNLGRETAGAFGGSVPEGMDNLLAGVGEQVYAFSERLPNYICDQYTERFASKSEPRKWKRKDRIENEILFIEGRENYRNFRRNGKKLKALDPMSSGMWSTGEFGTMLLDLFDPATAARFEFVREEEKRGVKTRLYDFTVKKENSHWRLAWGGEVIYPAFSGSIWVDPERMIVTRLEIRARDLPITYPEDVMEIAVDFGPVEIGGNSHVLALHSAALGCRRWKTTCTKNESDYRNYRMFSTESTVMQTDSTVTFEGDKKPPR